MALTEPRQTAPGSSELDDASAEVWWEQFGVRYRHVQQMPDQPSRWERRILARRTRLRNDGRAKTWPN